MLFLFVLSLLYLSQLAPSQTISESNEINRIIGEILVKAEKKNFEPIKFNWNEKITADGRLVTQHYSEIRSNEKKTKIFDPIPDAFSRSEPKKYSTSLKLQDIILEFNKIHSQTVRHTPKDVNTTKDDLHTTNSIKANHSSKTRTRYKNKMTPSMDKQPKVSKEQPITTLSILMTSSAMVAKLTNDTKPIKNRHSEGYFMKNFPYGSHDRFSESILKITKPFTSDRLKSTVHTTTKSKAQETRTQVQETTSQTSTPLSTTESTSSMNDLASKAVLNKIYTEVNKNRHYFNADSKSNNAVDDHNKQNILAKYITAKQWEGLKDIEDLVNSVPNYPVQEVTESLTDLINRLNPKKQGVLEVSNTTKVNYHQGDKKGIENESHNMRASTNSVIIPKSLVTEPITLSSFYEIETATTEGTNEFSTSTVSNTPSSDLYLLVDNRQKTLKGFFTLKIDTANVDTTKTSEHLEAQENIDSLITDIITSTDISEYTAVMETQTEDNTLKHKDVEDLYKEILNMYGNVKEVNEHDVDKPKSEKLHEKIMRNVNWDRIKKFFGHDRVCNCHCKANKTMCRVCSASDSVIRELTFEFNNLADFMNEHCTEIQTFFWLNPTGGKKLRDSVHRIDRTMHDYYKRVKGKCAGRTCKTFATYMDKRNLEQKKKYDKKYLEELLQDLGISEF